MARTHGKPRKRHGKDRLTPEERERRVAEHRAQAERTAAERAERRAQREERGRQRAGRMDVLRQLSRERRRLLDRIVDVFGPWSDECDGLRRAVKTAYNAADATMSSVAGTRRMVEEACADHERSIAEAEEWSLNELYGDFVPRLFGAAYGRVERSGLIDDVTFPLLRDLALCVFFGDDEGRHGILGALKRDHRMLYESIPLSRTLTGRLADVSTPHGQWLDLSMFREFSIGEPVPKDEENIIPIITGTAVELLVRGTSVETAGSDRIFGNARKAAVHVGKAREESCWERMVVHGTDAERAEAAVFLGAMECTYRSGQKYETPPPDSVATQHILSMSSTLQRFLDSRGGISSAGVEFRQEAFTPYVIRAEGDFLTPDTLWDCKVKVRKPEGKDLLQVLCYWILGVGSGDPTFDAVDRIGIVNPRLGKAWITRVQDVPRGVVLKAASYIIGYDSGDPRRTRIQARLDRQSLA